MKRIKKIVFVIISILLSLVLIYNIYNFISIKVLHKDLTSVNGYAMLEVVSGSMEPTILKGDIIIINTKKKNYKENDIITFRGKEGEFVTHRIISIDDKTMITKGDNNNTEDSPITSKAIVGKYVTKINGAGKILSSFKNPLTMAMIFIIGLLACVLLSTDKDGKPILDKDEKEFEEFLKNKNETKKEEIKKTDSSKKVSKKNSNSKNDKNKTNTTNKDDTKENKKGSPKTKVETSKNATAKKSTNKKNSEKKIEVKKDASTKKTAKPVAKAENKTISKASANKKTTTTKKQVVEERYY